VHGKADGEPDGRRVTDGRQVLCEAIVDEAPGVRDVLGCAFERVEIDVARQRPESGQHVRLCHRHQDQVGCRAHGLMGTSDPVTLGNSTHHDAVMSHGALGTVYREYGAEFN